eukprot:CAMPEP_0197534838 /NCGR_PEP_ID=MMETSP1318-20131121/48496_1 /TAXON_ID=552666 /ORGANISM="Partenskyella glossopodia, Strain RCC365" /LENGTH=408 /DNA_ID=CAMNT_0043092251 /DNA_START=232 /DNA_END=1458 /DNA_ORIENTATION=-
MELIDERDSELIGGKQSLEEFCYTAAEWHDMFRTSSDEDIPEYLTMRVDCELGPGATQVCNLDNSYFTALTLKNAICDAVRDNSPDGSRPDVDLANADLPLFIHADMNKISIYRVLNKETMHKRGYRPPTDPQIPFHSAPLRESLAAGLLMDTKIFDFEGLQRDDGVANIVVDPMCGSGTLCIEAALIACQTAPGLLQLDLDDIESTLDADNLKHTYVCGRWPDSDLELLRETIREAVEKDRRPIGEGGRPPLFYVFGSDVEPDSVEAAKKSAKMAGVAKLCNFETISCSELELSPESAKNILNAGSAFNVPIPSSITFVSNPPWDMRIRDAKEAWQSLGQSLKKNAQTYENGGTAYLLSGNKEITQELRMKAARRVPVKAGGVDLRWLEYSIFPAKKNSNVDISTVS